MPGLIQRARRRWFFRRGGMNYYYRTYPSLEAARADIRQGMTVGYDNEAAAGYYRDRLEKVFPADYPALFWLRPLIRPGARVVDFGGHVGLHFYSFRRLLAYPEDLTWTVSEVPAVVRAGWELATQRGVAAQLRFHESALSAVPADVVFSAGALQYLPPDFLAAELKKAPQLPSDIILNKIPVRDGGTIFTIQDTGVFQAPYTLFDRRELVASLEALSYELVDSWANPGHYCQIQSEPERSVREYSGLYFRRRAGG